MSLLLRIQHVAAPLDLLPAGLQSRTQPPLRAARGASCSWLPRRDGTPGAALRGRLHERDGQEKGYKTTLKEVHQELVSQWKL